MIEPAQLLRARILVVDDEPVNVGIIERILHEAGYEDTVSTCHSEFVLDLNNVVRPDLILLDLHMPDPDGFAVLEALQRHNGRRDDAAAVLVLTADISLEVKQSAFMLGAADFLTKPFDSMEVLARIKNLLENRLLHRAQRDQNLRLEERVRQRTASLERARSELLDRLALLAEYRDDVTYEHAQRVGRTSARIAAAAGVTVEEAALIRRAAPLHDIGKVAVPDAILLKPGTLTAAEFEVMTRHATIGARILARSGSPILRLAEEIARTHHERWDGTGYPAGLRGEEIPQAGRFVAIADVFDALTHNRPYKTAIPVAAAAAEIIGASGTHFDPVAVAVFAELNHEELLEPLDVAAEDLPPLEP
jgi:putative two-component system response regulator